MCSAPYDYADIAGGHAAEERQRQRGEQERGGAHRHSLSHRSMVPCHMGADPRRIRVAGGGLVE